MELINEPCIVITTEELCPKKMNSREKQIYEAGFNRGRTTNITKEQVFQAAVVAASLGFIFGWLINR